MKSPGPWRPDPVAAGGMDEGGAVILVGTARDWFAVALETVLRPAGFNPLRAHSSDEVLHFVEVESPDLVILDDDFPGMDVPALCRRLRESAVGDAIPIVVHASSFANVDVDAAALDNGAWQILVAPTRPRLLVATIRRLLKLRHQLERTSVLLDPETGFFTLAGLQRVVPSLGALALRRRSQLSCAVIGPTQVGRGGLLQRQRDATARLCSSAIRRSDVCGWIGEADLAIITPDTGPEGARQLVRRLNSLAAEAAELEASQRPISGGIAELEPGQTAARAPRQPASGGWRAENGQDGPEAAYETEVDGLWSIRVAQQALGRAREGGGGVEIVRND